MKEGKPSHTAMKVAKIIIALGEDPLGSKILPPDCSKTTYDILRASDLIRNFDKWIYQSIMFRVAIRGLERVFFSSFYYLAVRKRYIYDQVQAAIRKGACQVLNIGAGYEPLLTNLASANPHVRFVEIDYPSTATRKAKALETLGIKNVNLQLISADLALRSLPEVLEENGVDRSLSTVIITEGLLMYLPTVAVKSLIGAGSWFKSITWIATYVPGDEQGKIAVNMGRILSMAVRASGEPFLFLPTATRFNMLIEESGFKVLEFPDSKDLERRYLVPNGIVDHRLNLPERFVTFGS